MYISNRIKITSSKAADQRLKILPACNISTITAISPKSTACRFDALTYSCLTPVPSSQPRKLNPAKLANPNTARKTQRYRANSTNLLPGSGEKFSTIRPKQITEMLTTNKDATRCVAAFTPLEKNCYTCPLLER